MIEVRALKLFLALADELHFGRTAERLGLAQSALSNQILRIEDRIGARLFERGRRSAVSLTPAGRVFVGEARLAVAQVERAERIGRMAGRGEAGPAAIGFVFSAALSNCLGQALAALRAALPALEISAEPMETPEQIAAVSDGRLDLGFIRPRSTYPANVSARIIHREGLRVALAASHPLASHDAIPAAALAGQPFIYPQFSDTDGFGGTIERLADLGLHEPGPRLRTRDFVTALSMAAAGYGVVLAPESLQRLGLGDLVYRRIVGHSDQTHLALTWREGANACLLDVMSSCFPEVA